MGDEQNLVSNAFKVFMADAPAFAQALGAVVQALSEASELHDKTRDLAYLAVLVALNRTSGIHMHVRSIKERGAKRGEIFSAILVGLPATGHVATQTLPAAIEAFDAV